MRALYACELGGGFGNVRPLVTLAEALEREGVEPIFALADGVTPAPVFAKKPWLRLPAPALREPLRPRPGPASYGDILASCGFGDLETLSALVAQWDALIALVKPDFIVAGNAPSAILAVRGRLPVCAVGTGFTLPPAHTATFPALRPDTMSFRPEFVALDMANAVLRKRGAPLLATLPSLLAVEARLVETVAQLDPYAEFRREPYARLGGVEPALMRDDTNGVFAFLDVQGPETLNALDCLASLVRRFPVETYLRGPGAVAASGFLNRCGARTHVTPAPMAEALSRARVVISQGGHGTCLTALRAARASVVLPAHFEAMLNGIALERAGAGKVAWGGSAEAITEHLDWALSVETEKLQAAADQVAPALELDARVLLNHIARAMPAKAHAA